MASRLTFVAALCVVLGAAELVANPPGNKTGTRDASATIHDVLPILYLRCAPCHGTRRQEGGLDLRTRASMLKGGASGPAIVPGDPDASLLLKRIRAEEMPPRRRLVEVSVKPVRGLELDRLSRWIAAGAPGGVQAVRDEDDDGSVDSIAPSASVAPASSDNVETITVADPELWAFRPPRRPAVPSVQQSKQVHNPVDAFIVARLEPKGLALAPPAAPLELLRRVTFDLTGLPPPAPAAREFAADDEPDRYEKAVDRLLASPRYGERWGRHWLDVAGYSDSEGVQHADQIRPSAYRYRDYVISSLNRDKPYDHFLREQLAGDELLNYESADVITQEMYENLVATGFLRMSPDGTYANITNFVPDRLEQIGDQIEVVGSVMGLTLKCARCHAHKFDPIPQHDYYRLAAVFKGAYDEHDWLAPRARRLPFVTHTERRAWQEEREPVLKAISELDAKLAGITEERRQPHLEARILKLPEGVRKDVGLLLKKPADRRSESEEALLKRFESELTITDEELGRLDPEYQKIADELRAKRQEFEKNVKPEPFVRALWDRGEPSPTYLLERGDYLMPGRLVSPGVPAAVPTTVGFQVKPPWQGASKTGRRLAFARWLTSSRHPLTSRVIVNRIWKHHFGRGIVATLDNFGSAGAAPTHPELLDWLAVEFEESGWSFKHLHRLLLMSNTYRQTSRVADDVMRRDPDGVLYSRMPLRRLEAEAIRDALVAVTGRLDAKMFGPAVGVQVEDDGLIVAPPGPDGARRSVYVLQRRTQTPTLLESFDLPQMTPQCVERAESIVVSQALHLFHDKTVSELARSFASRVQAEVGADQRAQIEAIYWSAYGRSPRATEVSVSLRFLEELESRWKKVADQVDESNEQTDGGKSPALRALTNLCHAVLNSSGFVYVD